MSLLYSIKKTPYPFGCFFCFDSRYTFKILERPPFL
nr:MAG TPA: hypothetical protein [Caudoviricetes sp.]